MNKFTYALLASIILATSLFGQSTSTIATVNIQRVLSDYTVYQTTLERVKGSVAPAEEEIQKMQEKIEEIVTKGRELNANTNNPALDPESRASAESELKTLQAELNDARSQAQQFRSKAQELAQKGQRDDLAPLQQKAAEVIKEFAKEKGLILVLPMDQILYADEALEITDAVIAVLNEPSE
jgi:Skp family chaperone for outer membrane proteins